MAGKDCPMPKMPKKGGMGKPTYTPPPKKGK